VAPEIIKLKFALPVNWYEVPLLVPIHMYGLAGCTVMESGSLTVSVAELTMLFNGSVAEMVVIVVVIAVARPFEGGVLMKVTEGSAAAQITAWVQLIVVPSVRVAVAVNCCVEPVAINGLAGVIAIDIMCPPRKQLTSTIANSISAATIKMPRLIIFIIPVSVFFFNNYFE